MKQSDIFSIVVVASVGTLAAFFICQAIMGKPEEAIVHFTGLEHVIASDLKDPDPEVFNATAINPTIEVYVGDCEDLDKNGILDELELQACGRIEAPEEDEGGEDGGEGETTPEGE